MAELRLIPSHGGIFELWAGRPDETHAKLLFSRSSKGRFPLDGESIQAVRHLFS